MPPLTAVRFETEFGSSNCHQFTGWRLDTPHGRAHFKENVPCENCQVFTREAARLAMASLQKA